MRMKPVAFLLLVTAIIMGSVRLPAEIEFSGMLQTWLSYAPLNENNPVGFTLRRVRFTPRGTLSESLTWVLQFGWDKQTAALVDAYLEWKASEHFMLRLGKYTVPGTISSSLTSSSRLDMVERPEITLKWSQWNELSQYRSLGLQVHGNILNNKLYYAVMLANNSTAGLFTPTTGEAEYDASPGLTLWNRLEARPVGTIRIGAFYGRGWLTGIGTPRSSYGIHAFYVKHPIRFKIEYIAGEIEDEPISIEYHGMYALFGVQVSKTLELLVQYDDYSPGGENGDEEGVEHYKNITLGCNVLASKSIKLQANYVIRRESMAGVDTEEPENDLICINVQYTF